MTSALSTIDTAPLHSQEKNWGADASEIWQKVEGNKLGNGAKVGVAASDEELVAAICEGSEAALEELYERYHRQAFSLAYHMLHDAAAAEDILQESFVAVWRKAPSYQAQHGRVSTWLLAIVHHRAIDKLRSPGYRDQQCASLEDDPRLDLVSEQSDVWEQAWLDEQRRLVSMALLQIPVEQRQVIGLAYFGGYTHTEISEMWDIPLGTVKGRMRLGLQKLKMILREHGFDSPE